MRPHQWVKNLFVLAPLVFAQDLFDVPRVLRAALGVLLFSFVASAIYIINDIVDVEADRVHPKKKTRAIASGQISIPFAKKACAALVATSIGVGFAVLGWMFAATILAYFTLNIAYSFKLKHIAYIDVLCIALGFELRVLAGAFAIDVKASVFLLVVTFLLATFLGLGKRMHELLQGSGAHKQRGVLSSYGPETVSRLLYTTALATVATYAVYTLDRDTRAMFHTDYLVLTTLFTCFGVFRFIHLVKNRPDSESPTEEMLRDRWFILNLAVWAVAIVAIIYLT